MIAPQNIPAVHSIQGKILSLPNRPPFMLTADLAEIYECDRKQISQAVLRNPERFPEDFCFDLTPEEIGCLQNEDIISNQHFNGKQRAFTRHGANMLSTVLKSKVAASRAVQIVRAFSALEAAAQGEARPRPHAPATVEVAAARYIELLENENAALKRGAARYRKWTAEEDARLAEMRAQGLPWGEIGRRLGRGGEAAAHRLRALQARAH
jgi:hypothetical protein